MEEIIIIKDGVNATEQSAGLSKKHPFRLITVTKVTRECQAARHKPLRRTSPPSKHKAKDCTTVFKKDKRKLPLLHCSPRDKVSEVDSTVNEDLSLTRAQ